jgi:hypothetical protein
VYVVRIAIPCVSQVFTAPVKFAAESLNAADSRYGYAAAAPGLSGGLKNAGDQRTVPLTQEETVGHYCFITS